VSSPPSGDLSFLYFRMFWLFIGMALWNDGRHSGLICVCTCTIYSGWVGWDGVFIQFCSDLSTFLDEVPDHRRADTPVKSRLIYLQY
jgi:hypothetical protein